MSRSRLLQWTVRVHVAALPLLILLAWLLVKLFGYLDSKFLASATKQASRWPGVACRVCSCHGDI